ncbi:MAG: branched-chain amino acid ABC transporter permease [Rhodospirillales bacterium]|nr:branched-chain amino acid ABC transporter permease [Rhodospirillales bacterium]
MTLLAEQLLNGLQLGVMLFLMAAGLTLVFGIMGLINLAHGSFFMIGAFAAAWVANRTGSFLLALPAGLAASAASGVVVEIAVIRHLYARSHMDQVLATFGLIMFFDELMAILFGRTPLLASVPRFLGGSVDIVPGVPYPVFRLAIIVVGIAVAVALWWLIGRTRLGMLVRAGATNRDMVRALGVDIALLYTAVFGLGAMLAGLAGLLTGPLLSVQVGMGDSILITTFVVIVVGGVGSVRGALAGAMLVGMVDTLARAYLPTLLQGMMQASTADQLAGGLSSMAVFILMAVVLLVRPRGLFPAHG